MINVKEVFLTSLRMYFAPLVGAYKAIIAESRRYQQQHSK